MPIMNVLELTVYELCELYNAEHRFVEGQEEMVQAASDQDLQSSIQQHIEQTRGHAKNLQQVFCPSRPGPPAILRHLGAGFPTSFAIGAVT